MMFIATYQTSTIQGQGDRNLIPKFAVTSTSSLSITLSNKTSTAQDAVRLFALYQLTGLRVGPTICPKEPGGSAVTSWVTCAAYQSTTS